MDVELRVVCFDADQTLIDFRWAMRQALRNALLRIQSLSSEADTLTVQRLIDDRDSAAAAMGARTSMEAIRLEGFRRTLAPLGFAAEVIQDLTEGYLADRFRLARPYDDVVPALEALRQRYRLGLATNGNSYPDRAGLARYFGFHGVRPRVRVSKAGSSLLRDRVSRRAMRTCRDRLRGRLLSRRHQRSN